MIEIEQDYDDEGTEDASKDGNDSYCWMLFFFFPLLYHNQKPQKGR